MRLICGLILGIVFLRAPVAQVITTDFARLTNGGGLSSSANYQVQDAINTEPAGPGFHEKTMYNHAPVLWLENSSLQPYIDLITPPDGAAINGASMISVGWKTTPSKSGNGVQLELWRQNKLYFHLAQTFDPSGQGTFNAFIPFVPTASDYVLLLRSQSDPLMWDQHTIEVTSSGPNAVETTLWTLYH